MIGQIFYCSFSKIEATYFYKPQLVGILSCCLLRGLSVAESFYTNLCIWKLRRSVFIDNESYFQPFSTDALDNSVYSNVNASVIFDLANVTSFQQPTWRLWGEERLDGAVYTVYLKKVRYHSPSRSITTVSTNHFSLSNYSHECEA